MADKEKTTPGQIELIQAKYEGVDDKGRPYTITADKAARVMGAPDAVTFENPQADITLQDKTWVAMKGKTGSFDHATELLNMTGGVSVFHASGYEILLQDLTINLKKKTAETSSPVRAQGPMGSITAQNMAVRNEGELVIFGGPVTLTLFRLSTKEGRG
jgi:lipopolysaccharide export system protein LptC